MNPLFRRLSSSWLFLSLFWLRYLLIICSEKHLLVFCSLLGSPSSGIVISPLWELTWAWSMIAWSSLRFPLFSKTLLLFLFQIHSNLHSIAISVWFSGHIKWVYFGAQSPILFLSLDFDSHLVVYSCLVFNCDDVHLCGLSHPFRISLHTHVYEKVGRIIDHEKTSFMIENNESFPQSRFLLIRIFAENTVTVSVRISSLRMSHSPFFKWPLTLLESSSQVIIWMKLRPNCHVIPCFL